MNLKLKASHIFLLLSIIIFGAACSQKIYCTDGYCEEDWSGLGILIAGAFGVFMGGACITWLANPLILISWLTFKKIKISLITSILAFGFGISFLLFDEIIINEGGGYGKITGYGIGFYLWNLSFFIMIIRNLIKLTTEKVAT